MITKSSEIHNADRLIYAIIKCAVDDFKTELRGETVRKLGCVFAEIKFDSLT